MLLFIGISHGFGSSGNPDGSGPSKSLVLAQAVSTVSVQSGGGGWRQSWDKDRYNGKYRMSGVRWCKIVGMARPATVHSSAGTGDSSGISNSTEVSVGQPGNLRRDLQSRPNLSGMVGSHRVIRSSPLMRAIEPTSSRTPRSPVNKWSPTRERLHH
ncbi:hypothetical protein TIFTF001_016943 [Ficus carica]|uniref:Uncharacterized protein n=1 Tax=Ficus carica TaxID=3494 RepID=A0AA88D7T6_FICCA|nr:hypothetical protein TIFTF001_016943 [Ficus carica]